MKRLWWFICDCLLGAPWAITELQATYENCACPDCGESISHHATPGDECPNCGHVLLAVRGVCADRAQLN